MAIISSHTLNSVDGTHAGGIAVTLTAIAADGTRSVVFETATDEGGRIAETVEAPDPAVTYELVFGTGAYFAGRGQQGETRQFVQDVVVRFVMPVPDERYHFPVMTAPNSSSIWWSS